MQDSVCVPLPWDSSFFGFRIARLTPTHLSPDSLSEALSWCDRRQIDCLYFLTSADDQESVQLAESASFRFVDIRVRLALSQFPQEANDEADRRVRRFVETDLPALKIIARESHSDSRFYFDSGFPKERCDALFETWIERSCQGWAKAVFVAELNGAAAGYCTCHVDGGVGSIGLIALASHAQGQSLGRRLIAAAIAYVCEQGVSRLEVVTQGRNVQAQRRYQRCGFVTDSVMLWYHKWFPGAFPRLS